LRWVWFDGIGFILEVLFTLHFVVAASVLEDIFDLVLDGIAKRGGRHHALIEDLSLAQEVIRSGRCSDSGRGWLAWSTEH